MNHIITDWSDYVVIETSRRLMKSGVRTNTVVHITEAPQNIHPGRAAVIWNGKVIVLPLLAWVERLDEAGLDRLVDSICREVLRLQLQIDAGKWEQVKAPMLEVGHSVAATPAGQVIQQWLLALLENSAFFDAHLYEDAYKHHPGWPNMPILLSDYDNDTFRGPLQYLEAAGVVTKLDLVDPFHLGYKFYLNYNQSSYIEVVEL